MPVKLTTNIRYASSVLASGTVPVKGFEVEFVPPEPNTTVVFNDFIHKLTCDAIDLPLANLASGEYIIELTATTGTGEAKDRVAFRVTS